MVVHPPPCSSSGHTVIPERLVRPPPSEQMLLMEPMISPLLKAHFHHRLLRRCKGIRSQYFIQLEGNFSQVPRTHSLGLCAWEFECAVVSVLWVFSLGFLSMLGVWVRSASKWVGVFTEYFVKLFKLGYWLSAVKTFRPKTCWSVLGLTFARGSTLYLDSVGGSLSFLFIITVFSSPASM